MKTRNEDPTNRYFPPTVALPPDSVARFITEPYGDPATDPVIRLNFRAAPLEDVLNYLRLTAGFIIRVGQNVNVKDAVEVYDDQPLTREGAYQLLNSALEEIGCTALQDGRVTSIIRQQDAKKSYIPIPFPPATGVAPEAILRS